MDNSVSHSEQSFSLNHFYKPNKHTASLHLNPCFMAKIRKYSNQLYIQYKISNKQLTTIRVFLLIPSAVAVGLQLTCLWHTGQLRMGWKHLVVLTEFLAQVNLLVYWLVCLQLLTVVSFSLRFFTWTGRTVGKVAEEKEEGKSFVLMLLVIFYPTATCNVRNSPIHQHTTV